MLTGIGAWLRQQREARGWARREMAIRLTQAAHAVSDTTVPGIEHLCTYIRRWEFGRHGPTERYKLYYCTAFGIRVGQYGTAPPPEPKAATGTAVPALAGPHLAAPAGAAYRETYGSDPDGFAVGQEVAMAAHEGSEQAGQAEERGIGEATVEMLRADVARLARLVDTAEPLTVFLDMRRVRDRIHGLLDRQTWPRDRADLYFLMGCLNGMMGGTANCLGYRDAAEELIRSGWAYASIIDHRPLRGLLRLELSIVMYERGWFEASRDLAVSGLTYLSAGTEAADLHVRHALAAARLGDADAARRAVQEAHEARDPGYRDDLLELGGKFLISQATHYGFAGAALTAIPGAGREAADELERAIGLYDEGPGEREQHWFAGKPLASIDLAVARLRSGALDAAAGALEPAFSLPATQRITRVTARLAAARDELAAPIYRGSAQARELGEQIEEFGRETIVAGLHGITGG